MSVSFRMETSLAIIISIFCLLITVASSFENKNSLFNKKVVFDLATNNKLILNYTRKTDEHFYASKFECLSSVCSHLSHCLFVIYVESTKSCQAVYMVSEPTALSDMTWNQEQVVANDGSQVWVISEVGNIISAIVPAVNGASTTGPTTTTTTTTTPTTTTTATPVTFPPASTGRTGSVQTYNVSSNGCYNITALGAKGGRNTSPSRTAAVGGKGAIKGGSFNLTSGTQLSIVTGQAGSDTHSVQDDNGAGGGGGSFVYKTADNVLLVAAGGGGGGQSVAGGDGQAGTSGGNSIGSSNVGSGGTGGNGGSVGSGSDNGINGGAGAGWLSDGQTVTDISYQGGGGKSRSGGWLGGDGGSSQSNKAVGGFGGGGAGGCECENSDSDQGDGGGGGGYSGGGAGGSNNAGGGGGSYTAPEAVNSFGVTGGNTADQGSVTITYWKPTC